MNILPAHLTQLYLPQIKTQKSDVDRVKYITSYSNTKGTACECNVWMDVFSLLGEWLPRLQYHTSTAIGFLTGNIINILSSIRDSVLF